MGKLRKRQQGTGRRAGRIAAVWCILCVFVLQCFAVVTILPQEVFAAEGFKIEVKYKNGNTVKTTVSSDDLLEWSEELVPATIKTTDADGVETEVEIGALCIGQILSTAGIDYSDVEKVTYSTSGSTKSTKDYNKAFLILPGVIDDSVKFYCITGDGKTSPIDGFSAKKSNTSEVSGLTISSTLSLVVGKKGTITANVSLGDDYSGHGGKTPKIKWSSNNTSVATVDSNGKVTAKKAGTATITATVGDLSKTCKVTVKKKETTTTTTKATTKKHTSNRYRYTTRHTKRHNYNYRRYTRRYTSSYTRPSTSTSNSASTTTQTSASDTALEPAPGMMTVKEVTLTGAQLPQEDPYEDEFAEDESWDEEDEWAEDEEGEEWETASVDFGTGVGSAAVAALACGAGAVGRVRRFRTDMMGPKTKAAKTKTPADPSKPKKNPLSKLTKKK